MSTHLPGKFLKKKLSELNSALFFAEGDSLFKLPNHLITEMEMNDDGQIWFVIPKPVQDIEAFDKEFPVRLEFFKKGISFRLKVRGKGSIIGDRAAMETLAAASKTMHEKVENEPVIMIKVLVQFVDYSGNMETSFPTRLKMAGLQLSGWLFSHSKGTGMSVE
jgi:general stress protein 26